MLLLLQYGFSFRMGHGSVVGGKNARAVEKAYDLQSFHLLSFTVRVVPMQEGILSLLQMAKTSVAWKSISNAGDYLFL